MGVLQGHGQRVGREGGQICLREALEAAHERPLPAGGLHREAIGLELVPARPGVERDREQQVDRRVEQPEEQEARVHRRLVDVEGVEEALHLQEHRKQKKEHAGLHHARGDALGDVVQLVVAHLVGDHRQQLVPRELLHERVEQHDAPVRAEAGEEGIGFVRPARPVHHVHLVDRKLHRVGVRQDPFAERARLQRLKVVEEGHQVARGEELEEQHHRRHHDPGIDPAVRPGRLEEPEEGGQQRPAEGYAERDALEQVQREGLGRRLVKPEALLNSERGVDRERERQRPAPEHEEADVAQARRDGPDVPAAHQGVEPLEAARKPKDQQHGEPERRGEKPKPRLRAGIVPGPLVFIVVERVPKFVWKVRLEIPEGEEVRDEIESVFGQESAEDDNGVGGHAGLEGCIPQRCTAQ
jgi:hypothetical protein